MFKYLIISMKKWFKKFFIPHEGNEHQPHFLRSKSLPYLATCIIFFEIIFLAQIYIFPNTNLLGLIVSNTIIDETNVNRTKENLLALKTNPILNEAAQLKANDMASKGYFAHTSPEGITPWYWFNKAGYSFYYAGENLAVNFVDSKDVVNAWMNSPSHRANMVNYNFTEIGIGIAKGQYKGSEAVFVVQMFGRPRSETVAVVKPKTNPLVSESTPTPTPLPLFTPSIGPETFVAVKGIENENLQAEMIPEELIINTSKNASILEKIMGQPKWTINYIELIFGGLILIALILTIFIRVKIQYPKLIANGAFLLTVIAVIILANQFISLYQTQIL
jgi:uncharacterized protein YkwD